MWLTVAHNSRVLVEDVLGGNLAYSGHIHSLWGVTHEAGCKIWHQQMDQEREKNDYLNEHVSPYVDASIDLSNGDATSIVEDLATNLITRLECA